MRASWTIWILIVRMCFPIVAIAFVGGPVRRTRHRLMGKGDESV